MQVTTQGQNPADFSEAAPEDEAVRSGLQDPTSRCDPFPGMSITDSPIRTLGLHVSTPMHLLFQEGGERWAQTNREKKPQTKEKRTQVAHAVQKPTQVQRGR